jgi:hypothetical protein
MERGTHRIIFLEAIFNLKHKTKVACLRNETSYLLRDRRAHFPEKMLVFCVSRAMHLGQISIDLDKWQKKLLALDGSLQGTSWFHDVGSGLLLELRPIGCVKEGATALADLAVWCLRSVGITERSD